MAIAVDQASIGTNADPGAASTTVALTTTATVASNGFIVLMVGYADPGAAVLSSVSGGGLTWAIDRDFSAGFGDNCIAICSAQAPSGLASGSTITATFSASTNPRRIAGSSFTGVATSSALDTTTTGNVQNPATNWTSTAISTAEAGELIYGVNTAEVVSTSTATTGTEAFDFNGSSRSTTAVYRIEAASGSYAVAGTWGATAGVGATISAAYKAGAGGSPPITNAPEKIRIIQSNLRW